MLKRQAVIALGSTLIVLAVARPARAQSAAYATPDDLKPEGLSHLLDVAMLGQYSRVADPDAAGGLRDVGVFALRSRFYLWRTVSHCAGLDGEVGASNEGFVYGVTGYLVGLGVRWGAGNVISLCGGVGVDRYGSAVPVAAKFPADLSAAFDLGPIRPILWLRPSWISGSDARQDGATPSFVDELEMGLLVRLSKQHRYWSHTSAGGGLALGVSYRELMDTHAISAMLGFDFAGEQ
jgi:hypothetical protein